MGRKIDIKMIENATRRQVTYSKRRASLIKKAHELSVFCDVDVLLLVFSPSRRVTTYCSRNRIEDLLERFINLPTVKKYEKNPNMKNVAEKLERLKGIESINGDENKLHYLNNRINHLELQKKKSAIDLELLSATLRDFEPPSGDQEDHAVAQAMLCMRNLTNSLQKVLDRKSMLLGNRPSLVDAQSRIGDDLGTGDDLRKMIESVEEDLFLAYNFGGVELNRRRQNLNSSCLIRQLDPWLSPYSNKARERILEGASGQLRNGVNAPTQMPQSVPTFPTMPPRVQSEPSPPNYFHAPHQPPLPTRTSSHPLPPPPPPLSSPCNQAQQQRALNRPFPPQLPTAANWMPPPAMYNQQEEDALENPFMSYSNWNHGEGSSSHFQANPIEQGIPEGIDFTVQPNTTQAPNQQSYQNENNHDNSHVVANVNDKSSDLIGEILAQHQLCSNTVNDNSHEVANVNENGDGHVEDFLVQDQLEDDDNNNNSNEVSEEIEINPCANIDEILAIQDSETEIVSLDALFEEIEKMASGKEGNQESGSTEWDGFALAQSLNTTDFDITNYI